MTTWPAASGPRSRWPGPTTASFQVLDGSYSPVNVPGSLATFDDREIAIDADGTFEIRFGPGLSGRNAFPLAPGAAMLVVREVFSDWATEQPGMLRIHRAEASPASAWTSTAASSTIER